MSEDQNPKQKERRMASRRPGLTLLIPPREEHFVATGEPLPLPRPPQMPQARENSEQIDPSVLEKLEILGCGNGGKVYKVRHRITQSVYALKVVHGNHDLSTRLQIVREMDILRTTNSPYVVKCHGVYDRAGKIQFVLEYMDRCGRMSEPYLAAVATQVLRGLKYLALSQDRAQGHQAFQSSTQQQQQYQGRGLRREQDSFEDARSLQVAIPASGHTRI